MAAQCPECEAALDCDQAQAGEIIVCPDCGVDLEVIRVSPSISLTLAPKEAEDWGE